LWGNLQWKSFGCSTCFAFSFSRSHGFCISEFSVIIFLVFWLKKNVTFAYENIIFLWDSNPDLSIFKSLQPHGFLKIFWLNHSKTLKNCFLLFL
jgi:hypothetical protein